MGWADFREKDRTPVMATAEEYGGPLRACVAMMMLRSGASIDHRYPDLQLVQAFARQNPDDPGDLRTALGAAASFSDRGQQLRFVGLPSRSPVGVSRWRQMLTDRASASVEYRRPRPEDLAELLSDHAGWIVKLDVPGEAVGEPELSYQPCILYAERDGVLVVHNPGNEGIKAQAYQEIPIAAALGQSALAARHASIMAVSIAPYNI